MEKTLTTNCPLCGTELVEGKCPNETIHLKPMCLNCKDCTCDTANGSLFCENEGNKQKTIEKMVAAVGDSYAVDVNSIVLKPLPLKDATKKCKQWTFNVNVLKTYYGVL